jgi:hypothetical protein
MSRGVRTTASDGVAGRTPSVGSWTGSRREVGARWLFRVAPASITAHVAARGRQACQPHTRAQGNGCGAAGCRCIGGCVRGARLPIAAATRRFVPPARKAPTANLRLTGPVRDVEGRRKRRSSALRRRRCSTPVGAHISRSVEPMLAPSSRERRPQRSTQTRQTAARPAVHKRRASHSLSDLRVGFSVGDGAALCPATVEVAP